jgi:hypothetical protein
VPATRAAENPDTTIAPQPQTMADIHSIIMHEIDVEFERVKNDTYLMDCSAKLRALTQLRLAMKQRFSVSPLDAKSVGDVLVKVLQEPELKSGKPLYEFTEEI